MINLPWSLLLKCNKKKRSKNTWDLFIQPWVADAEAMLLKQQEQLRDTE